jgi:hypothetical protein
LLRWAHIQKRGYADRHSQHVSRSRDGIAPLAILKRNPAKTAPPAKTRRSMNKRLHSRFRPRNAAPQNEGADFFTENVATRMKNTAASNSMIQLK